MNLKFTYLPFLLFLVACGPSRNLVYFSDLNSRLEYSEKILNIPEPIIQADDLLNISVTSLSSEANIPFNNGGVDASARSGYLVDKDGLIDYPVLGKIKLGGLTKTEAKNRLTEDLKRYLKEPVVRIQFLNYKVTVIGEVNNPSTFTIPSERINIIEALGLAGDMTVYGKRENVLIIREEGGIRKITRLNLNKREVLNSPYFYLRQNDMVYVEPARGRQLQASTFRGDLSFALSILSILSLVIFRFL